MIAGVVPLAVFSLLETVELGNTLIRIGPFVVPETPIPVPLHCEKRDQRTAGFEELRERLEN